MCGIAGILARGRTPGLPEQIVAQMTERLRHRGPDDSGVWSSPDGSVCLGHRRLSIIDLSQSGHQPMASRSNRYQLTFNGEIYNYPELRRELLSAGHSFRGRSDTEVLLAAFDAWGVVGTLGRTVGMYAMAVWDSETRELLLIRDRLGEKPLYYGWVGSDFVFASELKAFRAHPNWVGNVSPNALGMYLRHSYVPEPWSIFESVRKVPAGSITTVTSNVEVGAWPTASPYWMLPEAEPLVPSARSMSDSSALDALEILLADAIKGQMLSDAPLGAFLSGGVDSSLVVAAMQRKSDRPIRTFTIGFEEPDHDESGQAAAVAQHLGTDHTESIVTAGMARELIPELPLIYDEPFADASQIPTIILSRLAAGHVKVCLTGDGADESFGGYGRYLNAARANDRLEGLPPFGRRIAAAGVDLFRRALWYGLAKPVVSPAIGGAATTLFGDRLVKGAEVLRSVDRGSLYQTMTAHHWRLAAAQAKGASLDGSSGPLGTWLGSGVFEQDMMHRDLMEYLPGDLLVKVDRAAMSASLETRAPFLDHRIVEFASGLPLSQKIERGSGKILLRRLLKRFLPGALIRPEKRGFTAPVGEWVRGPLRDWAEDLLDERRLRDDGYLDVASVRAMWRQHVDGVHDWRQPVWDVLMFQAWLATQSS
jgi:asparagine synthase (glutamine-hydrolysing)